MLCVAGVPFDHKCHSGTPVEWMIRIELHRSTLPIGTRTCVEVSVWHADNVCLPAASPKFLLVY